MLTDKFINSFENEASRDDPTESIPLPFVRTVCSAEDDTKKAFSFVDSGEQKVVAGPNTFYFYCESLEEKDSWISLVTRGLIKPSKIINSDEEGGKKKGDSSSDSD